MINPRSFTFTIIFGSVGLISLVLAIVVFLLWSADEKSSNAAWATATNDPPKTPPPTPSEVETAWAEYVKLGGKAPTEFDVGIAAACFAGAALVATLVAAAFELSRQIKA